LRHLTGKSSLFSSQGNDLMYYSLRVRKPTLLRVLLALITMCSCLSGNVQAQSSSPLALSYKDKAKKDMKHPVRLRPLDARLTRAVPDDKSAVGTPSSPAVRVSLLPILSDPEYVRPVPSVERLKDEFLLFRLPKPNSWEPLPNPNAPFQDAEWAKKLEPINITHIKADPEGDGEVILFFNPVDANKPTQALPAGDRLYVVYLAKKQSDKSVEAQVHAQEKPDPQDEEKKILVALPLTDTEASGPSLPPRIAAAPRQPVVFDDLSVVMVEGLEPTRQRKIPAVRLRFPPERRAALRTALDQYVTALATWEAAKKAAPPTPTRPIPPFRVFRLFARNQFEMAEKQKVLFQKPAVENDLYEVQIEAVEENPSVAGEVFLFIDKSDLQVVPDAKGTPTTGGDARKVRAGDPLYVAFVGTDIGLPAVVHGDPKEKEKNPVKEVAFAPPAFETTRIDKELSISQAEVDLVPRRSDVRVVGITSVPNPVPLPPLTPPDRQPATVTGLTNREKGSVQRVEIPGVEFSGTLPSFLGLRKFGAGSIRLTGLLSSNARDPDSSLQVQFTATRGLRVAHGYEPRLTALHPKDEGILFAPSLDLITTQRVFGGDAQDSQYQINVAPVRFRFSTKGRIKSLLGAEQRRVSSEAIQQPGSSLGVNVALFETDYHSFRRTVPAVLASGQSTNSALLRGNGWQGPYITIDGTWRVPGLLRLPGKPVDEKSQIAFEAKGYIRWFLNDRNAVVQDSLRDTNNGILPFDLPSFPNQASDYELSLIVPLNLGIREGTSERFRIGYRSGFPRSQSFYDIFASNRSVFFIELRI
jgi:hypothetical protein